MIGDRRAARVLVVLALYVIPLGGAVAFLLAHDLPEIALALLLVEAGVVGAVLWARAGSRGTPATPRGPRPPGEATPSSRRQGLLIVAGLVVVTVGTVALAVVGSELG